MFYIDNDSGVTVMPSVSAQRSAIVRWFSEGDGNNVITWPGMDWFNIVQAELLNTLAEAGIQPDKTKLNQLALSIKAIMSNNALLKENNLSEIKSAGASAQREARENLDIYDATLNKKGLVQLTSDTDSDSETLAATAKAVKTAMDNGDARLAKDQNGADIPDKATFVKNISAALAFSGSVNIGGDNGNWTTAQFIDWLESQGAFNHPYWMCKGSWSYASNKIITDTDCGNIQLAGAVVEVMGTKSAMTIRITTPTTATNGTTKAQFTYINHGNDYSPGWRRDWNRAGDTMTGELVSTSANAFRMIGGNYGAFWRNDGNNVYLLLTDSGDQYGSWNSLRPFIVSLDTGKVTMGHSLAVTGTVTPTDYSNFDSRYALKTAAVTSIRLGTYITHTMKYGTMFEYAGYVITGLGIIGEVDGDDPARLRPLQYCINGSWYTAATT